jgi:hypothetical protein
MTNARYVLLFTALGRLARIYDATTQDLTALRMRKAQLLDAIATGQLDGSGDDFTDIIAGAIAGLNATVRNGPQATQTWVIIQARAILMSSDFRSWVSTPPSANINACLTALAEQLAADGKTLTTLTNSGLVNFFAQLGTSSTTFPQSDTASYPDATYVTDDVPDSEIVSQLLPLAYAADLTPDANDGLYRKCSLAGAMTLHPPTHPSDGMRWECWLTASGADRNLTFDANIRVPDEADEWSGGDATKTLASGKTYILLLKYSQALGKWLLISFVGGY